MKQNIKVAIVDDSISYREMITLYLRKHSDIDIVFICSNGKELIEALPKLKVDAILLDIIMPIMDGIETTEYLSKHYPEIKILILTIKNDKNLSNELIEKGANVYLLKDNGIEQVADAIYTLFKYEHYFEGFGLNKTFNEKNIISNTEVVLQEDISLSNQEKIILRYICDGLSSKTIGEKMFLSNRTIENKRLKLYQKTNTNNIAELIQFSFKNKII